MIKKDCKKLVLTMVSAAILSSFTAAAATDDIPYYGNTMHGMKDAQQLKWDLIHEYGFNMPLSYLGHMLGYGWAGGTAAPYIGEDMYFEQINNDTYKISANYRSNDPYSGGYMSDQRLEMTLNDVHFYTEPNKLNLGTPQVYNRQPVYTTSSWVTNCSYQQDTATTVMGYTGTTSWSKSDNFSFQESISVTNTVSVNLGFVGGSTAITAAFSATQGWSETNGNATAIAQSQSYAATIPARSKRRVTGTLFKQQADIPYTSEIYLGYDVDFYNFLRWGGNARNDHPTNRPFYHGIFGKNGLDAGEDIIDQYLHRDINGYGEWDWEWMRNTFGTGLVQWTLGNLSRREFGAPITGKFEAIDGTQFNITAGNSVPVESWECGGFAATKGAESEKLNSLMMEQQRLDNSASKISGSDMRIEVIENEYLTDDTETVKDVTFTLIK